MNTNINERVLELSPYIPGKSIDELERELGIEDSIKLASNENPRGPSAQVLSAIQSQFDSLTRYPDPDGLLLKQEISKHLGVETDQITLGKGSNDVLELAARVALSPGTNGVVDEHCFVVFPIAISVAHGRVVRVPSNQWTHDLERTLEMIDDDTRIVFIANPNNPTGTYIDETTLCRFIERVPESVWIVLDEAYFDYVKEHDYPDGVTLASQYPNLIATRTFSKAYGLASLRVGYSISSSYFAGLLNRVRQPFNVSSLALSAAVAAMKDREYLDESVELNAQEMSFLQNSLDEMGFSYIPSVANFLTMACGGDGNDMYQKLLRMGVIVRPIANYGMPNHLRVTVGTHDENVRFLDALQHASQLND